MSIVWNTPESTVWHRLEISVSSVSRVMLMSFLISVPSSESLVGIGTIANILGNVIVNHHSF